MKTVFFKKNIGLLLGFFTSLLITTSAQAAQLEQPYTTAYRYDPAGRLTATIMPDPDGSGSLRLLATRNIYNATTGLLDTVESGELADWADEDKPVTAWTGFTIYSIQSMIYDTYGRKTIVITKDKNGNPVSLTQTNYDTNGRANCVAVRMNKASFTSPNSLPDACTLSAAGSDGPDRIKQFTYNGFDQVLTETRALGTSLVQTYVTNIYSGRQLVGQIDANGNRTDLYYDANGRLKRMIYPSPTTKGIANGTGTGTTGDFVEFTYDANGNKKTERKRSGAVIAYTYDANNRPIFKDLADNTKDVCFDYDLRGLKKQAHFSSNYTTTACTNSPGITNTFDGFGNIATATTNQLGMQRVLNYTYDLNNNRTSITHPDGTIFSYSFDKTNRVLGVSDSVTPNNNVLTVNYQANGRRQSITRNGNSATTTQYNFNNGIQLSSFVQNFPASTNALTNSFTYNASSQIQSLTKSNSIYYYTGSDDRNGAYVPDGLNRYKTVGASTLDYDLNSNLYRDGTQYYSYDDENRLVGASGPNSANIVYDPNGRLFQTTINGTSVQYLYDGDALVAEYNTSGTLLRRYIHGDQVDEPWVQYNGASLAAGNRRYLHSDHQGSIIAHSDVSGNVLATLAYDTYGIPKAQNISVDGAFAYTGQIRLTGLGLYHYKARAYDPKLGRFLQTDPIGYKDDMDLYSYVGNDPINKTDPSGLYTCAGGPSGDEACKKIDSFVTAVNKALKSDKLSRTEKSALTRVSNYLGAKGQVNGVKIMASGSTQQSRAEGGNYQGKGILPDENKALVAIHTNKYSSDEKGGGAVAHEIEHALQTDAAGRGPRSREEEYKREQEAYEIESSVLKGNGAPGYSQSDINRGAELSTEQWCYKNAACN